MPAFKDASGKEWTIALDGIALKELRDVHKLDLSDVAGSVYSQLKRDPASLTVALAFLCADQIKDANLTPKKFAAALVGQAIEDAYAALWRAAELFFPPSLWSALSTRLEQETQEANMRQAMKALAMLEDAPPEIRDQVYAEITKSLPDFGSLLSQAGNPSASGPDDTRANAATNSLALSESTRAA